MKRPWRVAILGAGIGAEHAAGLAALPRHFTVATVCDRDAARAAALARAHGAQVETEMDAVLADPDIDILDICLPPRMHVPATLAALAAGKHAICEKPLAGALSDVDAIMAAAAESGCHVFPVFQYRYGPAARALERLKRRDLLGPLRVATLETHWNRDAAYYNVPWRGTRAHEMGGAIVSHAIHLHDLICTLGGPVAEVSAYLATAINAIETEDCAAVAMRLVSGALVNSSITLGAARDETRLKLVYQKASVESGRAPYAPCASDWTITAREEKDAAAMRSAQEEAALSPGRRHTGFAGFFDAVARSLAAGSGGAWMKDGRRSIELASAIYLSAQTRQSVALPLSPESAVYTGWDAL